MRRRRYRKRPEIVRRQQPLMIECHGAPPDELVRTVIGNDVYIFTEDGHGRKVALVAAEEHIDCFLARPEMYRSLGGGQ